MGRSQAELGFSVPLRRNQPWQPSVSSGGPSKSAQPIISMAESVHGPRLCTHCPSQPRLQFYQVLSPSSMFY